jgi:hypothetical protein
MRSEVIWYEEIGYMAGGVRLNDAMILMSTLLCWHTHSARTISFTILLLYFRDAEISSIESPILGETKLTHFISEVHC